AEQAMQLPLVRLIQANVHHPARMSGFCTWPQAPQSSRTKVILKFTCHSAMLSSRMTTLCSFTHAFRMLCTVLESRFMTSCTASSYPVVELAELSMTFAIAMLCSCWVESELRFKQVLCQWPWRLRSRLLQSTWIALARPGGFLQ